MFVTMWIFKRRYPRKVGKLKLLYSIIGLVIVFTFCLRSNTRETFDDVTLVTAYFNIGAFPKGDSANIRDSSSYRTWMKAYGNIRNPVIAFFEHGDPLGQQFVDLRKQVHASTKVIKINRTDLHSFHEKDRIAEIFSRPGYPKHLPNTVIPEYACISLAKFELIERVIEENLLDSEYIAWVDLGYWRWPIPLDTKIILPPEFNKSQISFTEIFHRDPDQNYGQIFELNQNWVAAGMILGAHELMTSFIDAYMKNADYFLGLGYFGAEQQLIYSMVNTATVPAKLPHIQTYKHPRNDVTTCPDPWMYLGCVCWQYYEKQRGNAIFVFIERIFNSLL